MAIKLIMTAEQMKDEEAWLTLRNKYIGGSDASTVAGFNKWKSLYQLWAEKTGRSEKEDLSNNLRIWFGKRAEELVAERFTLDTGKKVHKTGVWVNDKYPWACASIDRMIVGENSFLECKTSSGFNKEKWQDDEIPDNYYCQILHYMAIMEMDYCYIACLFDNGSEYIYKKVKFNREDAYSLMELEKNFFEQNISKDIEPPVDGSTACTEMIKNKYKGGDVDRIEISSNADVFAEKLEEIEAQEKILKQDKQEYQNLIKTLLKDHEEGYSGNYTFFWRTTAGRKTIDSKKLKAMYPDAYNDCLKEATSSRRFSFKKIVKE